MSTTKRALSIGAFALGALARRRGKNLAVAAALALVTAAFGSVFALTDSLREEARRNMLSLPDLTVSRLRGGRPALIDRSATDAIANIPAVASVRARVWGYVYLEGLESNLVVTGLPADADLSTVGTLVRGRAPRAGERGWVVLGDGVLGLLGAQPGDGLGLGGSGRSATELTIAGSFRSASALTTADVALMSEPDARAVLGIHGDEAADLAVTLTNVAESSVVARHIGERLAGTRVVERSSLARAYDLTYGTRGGLVALVLLPALLALLVLAWDRATGLSVEERHEVGVLKCLGWSTHDVIAARMAEAGFVAAGAGLVAGVVTYVYVYVARAPGLLHALLGWSSMHPDFDLAPASDGTSVGAVAILSVLPYVAAAIVPAWRAAVVDPADAMRG